MGNRTLVKDAPNPSDYKGLRGVAKAVKEARSAGYGDNVKKYFDSRKQKQASLQERNRTRGAGNAGSMVGNGQTLG